MSADKNRRDHAQLKRVLFRCLDESGKIIRKGFGSSYRVKKKGPVNLVTEIDTRAEDKIISIIRKEFPAHRILAEESSPYLTDSDTRWIIDPLDGTTNFAHQIPLCCASIGVEVRGEVILGGIYNPMMEECFFAEQGGGAFLNGKKVRASQTKKLIDCLLVTGFPYDRRERADFYLKYFKAVMERTQGVRRLGAAALDLAYVACGRFDAFWEFNLKPWDIAAGCLLVKEAGGSVSDFKGNGLQLDRLFELLASNGKIHSSLRAVLTRAE